MRTNYTTRRPNLMLKDKEKKVIYLVDMVCSIELKKSHKESGGDSKVSRADCRNRLKVTALQSEDHLNNDWLPRRWDMVANQLFKQTV